MNRITKETLRQILIDGENDTIEFKRVIPSQFYMVERMISAFANTRGGSVIYGYDEQNRDVVGVGYDQIRRLQNIINSEKYGSICNVYAIEIEGKLIAVMDVQKSKVTMYVKGVAYTRNGSGTFSKVGNIRSKHLKIFVDEIQYRNRNPRNTQVLKLLDAVDTNP
ncbi:MAG: ATP-binding protein, partial [Firmicutes bacterium]|nr:ATP-binding protein [Bacillota bacterium]